MWYTRESTTLYAHWEPPVDEESGLAQVYFGIGTGEDDCKGNPGIIPWVDPHHGLHENDWQHGGHRAVDPQEPGPYYASIKALNTPVFGGQYVTTVCHTTKIELDLSPPTVEGLALRGVHGYKLHEDEALCCVDDVPGHCSGTECVKDGNYEGDNVCSRLTQTHIDGLLCSNAVVQVDYNAMDPSCAELCTQKGVGDNRVKQVSDSTAIPRACWGSDPTDVCREYSANSAVFQFPAAATGSYVKRIAFALGSTEHNDALASWAYHCVSAEDPKGDCLRTKEELLTKKQKEKLEAMDAAIEGGLPEGAWAFARVKSMNNVDMSALGSANRPFKVDSSAPSCLDALVMDGIRKGYDMKFTNDGAKQGVNFENFVDIHSGVQKYDWCTSNGTFDEFSAVLTTAGNECFRYLGSGGAWKGIRTRDTPWTHETVYRSWIRAWNNGHLDATDLENRACTKASSGILFDSTPPNAGTADIKCKGNDKCEYSQFGNEVEAGWNGFGDPESNVVNYEYSIDKVDRSDPPVVEVGGFRGKSTIGCAAGESFFSHRNFPDCSINSFARTDQAIPHGGSYQVSVTGIDGAMWSKGTISQTVTVDETPPSLDNLNDVDDKGDVLVGYTRNDDAHRFSYSVIDEESLIKQVDTGLCIPGSGGVPYCMESTSKPVVIPKTDRVGSESAAINTSLNACRDPTIDGCNDVEGKRVFAKVEAFNQAGSQAHFYSDGTVIDTTPASIVKVALGTSTPYEAEDVSSCALSCPAATPLANSDCIASENSGFNCDDTNEHPNAILWTDTTSLTFSWHGSDATSGLGNYKYFVYELPESSGATGTVWNPKKTSNEYRNIPVSGSWKDDWTLKASDTVPEPIRSTRDSEMSHVVFLNETASMKICRDYVVCVQAFDVVGNAPNTVHCSPNIMHIVEKDQAGIVYNGPGDAMHTFFQASRGEVSVNFGGFESMVCGIVRYDWAIGTTMYSDDVKPFHEIDALLMPSTPSHNSSCTTNYRARTAVGLQDGVKYYSTIRAVFGCPDDAAGHPPLSSSSDFFVSDTTPPAISGAMLLPTTKIGIVNPWASGDYDVDNATVSGRYTVTEATAFTNVVNTAACLSSNPTFFGGCSDSILFNDSLINETKSFNGTKVYETEIEIGTFILNQAYAAFPPGSARFLHVVATNNAGLTSVATAQLGLTVDMTAPAATTVVCPKMLGEWNTLACTWDAFPDEESPITEYDVSIVTENNAGTMKMQHGWKLAQDQTLVNIDPIALRAPFRPPYEQPENETYRLKVTAWNVVGDNTTVFSETVAIDAIRPTAGMVDIVETEGSEKPIFCQASYSHVTLKWSNFVDHAPDGLNTSLIDNGIVRYEIAVGLAAGTQELSKYEDNIFAGNVQTATIAQFGGPGGVAWDGSDHAGRLYVSVRAVDRAGLVSDAVSAFVAVNTRLATPPIVIDGLDTIDLEQTDDVSLVSARWTFDDPCPIVMYEWAVFSFDEERILFRGQARDSVDKDTFEPVLAAETADGPCEGALPVCFPKSDGDCSTDCSDSESGCGRLYLNITDGNKKNTTYLCHKTTGEEGVLDDSTTAKCAATCLAPPVAKPSKEESKYELVKNSISTSELQIEGGVGYYVKIRATNMNGKVTEASSNGVLVLMDPPIPGTVYDGLTDFVDYNLQSGVDILAASWDNFIPSPGSDIVKYMVAFGTGNGADGSEISLSNVVPFTDVKLNTTVQFRGLELDQRGPIYFCTVVAVTGNGRESRAISNGIRVGYSDPVIPGEIRVPAALIWPPQGANADLTESAVDFSFSNFKTAHEILYYEVAVGTVKRSSAAQNFNTDDWAFDVMNWTCVCLEGVLNCPGYDGAPCESPEEASMPPLPYADDPQVQKDDKVQLLEENGLQYTWQDTQYLLTLHLPTPTIVQGETAERYYISVRAFDSSAMFTASSSSHFVYDPSDPSDPEITLVNAGHVVHNDGNDDHGFWYAKERNENAVTKLHFKWEAADEESGISAYEIALVPGDTFNMAGGSQTGECFSNIADYPDPSFILVKSPEFIFLHEMQWDDELRLIVRATNGVGLISQAISDPIFLDSERPTLGRVHNTRKDVSVGKTYNGEFFESDIVYTSTEHKLSASLIEVFDEVAMGCYTPPFNFTMASTVASVCKSATRTDNGCEIVHDGNSKSVWNAFLNGCGKCDKAYPTGKDGSEYLYLEPQLGIGTKGITMKLAQDSANSGFHSAMVYRSMKDVLPLQHGSIFKITAKVPNVKKNDKLCSYEQQVANGSDLCGLVWSAIITSGSPMTLLESSFNPQESQAEVKSSNTTTTTATTAGSSTTTSSTSTTTVAPDLDASVGIQVFAVPRNPHVPHCEDPSKAPYYITTTGRCNSVTYPDHAKATAYIQELRTREGIEPKRCGVILKFYPWMIPTTDEEPKCVNLATILEERPDLLCPSDTNDGAWDTFGCQLACRYNPTVGRCMYIAEPPTHRVRMWAWHDQPASEFGTVQYAEVDLYDEDDVYGSTAMDPSKKMHEYALSFTYTPGANMEKIWDAELSIDGKPRTILENVPGFKGNESDVIFASHLFSFSSIEDVIDAFGEYEIQSAWGGSATIESAELVHPDRITCKDRNEVFFNKQPASELKYQIAVGTAPFVADIVPLMPVSRDSTISVKDRFGKTIKITSTHNNFVWESFDTYKAVAQMRTCSSSCIPSNVDCTRVLPQHTVLEGSEFGILDFVISDLNLDTVKNTSSTEYLRDSMLATEIYNSDPQLAACRQSMSETELEELAELDAATGGASSSAADLTDIVSDGFISEAATYYVSILAENNAGLCVSTTARGVTIDVTNPLFENEDCNTKVQDLGAASSDDPIVVTQNISKIATSVYELVDKAIYKDEKKDIYSEEGGFKLDINYVEYTASGVSIQGKSTEIPLERCPEGFSGRTCGTPPPTSFTIYFKSLPYATVSSHDKKMIAESTLFANINLRTAISIDNPSVKLNEEPKKATSVVGQLIYLRGSAEGFDATTQTAPTIAFTTNRYGFISIKPNGNPDITIVDYGTGDFDNFIFKFNESVYNTTYEFFVRGSKPALNFEAIVPVNECGQGRHAEKVFGCIDDPPGTSIELSYDAREWKQSLEDSSKNVINLCAVYPAHRDINWELDNGAESPPFGRDLAYQGSTDTVYVVYQAVDKESPIVSYDLILYENMKTVLDSKMAILPQQDGRTSFTAFSGNFKDGNTYCVKVIATNAAKLSQTANTSCTIVDSTPPNMTKFEFTSLSGTVTRNQVGQKIEGPNATSTTVLITTLDGIRPEFHFNFSGHDDSISGIIEVQVGIGFSENSDEAVPFFPISNDNSPTEVFIYGAEAKFKTVGADDWVNASIDDIRAGAIAKAYERGAHDYAERLESYRKKFKETNGQDFDEELFGQPGQQYYVNFRITNGAHLTIQYPGPKYILMPKDRSSVETCEDMENGASDNPLQITFPDALDAALPIFRPDAFGKKFEIDTASFYSALMVESSTPKCAATAAFGSLSPDAVKATYTVQDENTPLYIKNSFDLDLANEPSSDEQERKVKQRITATTGANIFITPLSADEKFSMSSGVDVSVTFDTNHYDSSTEFPMLLVWDRFKSLWRDWSSLCGPHTEGGECLDVGGNAVECTWTLCGTAPAQAIATGSAAFGSCVTECSHTSCQQIEENKGDCDSVEAAKGGENKTMESYHMSEAMMGTIVIMSIEAGNTKPTVEDVTVETKMVTVDSYYTEPQRVAKLEYNDADGDIVFFELGLKNYTDNAVYSVPGKLEMENDGTVSFYPTLYFTGDVVVQYRVTEVQALLPANTTATTSDWATLTIRVVGSTRPHIAVLEGLGNMLFPEPSGRQTLDLYYATHNNTEVASRVYVLDFSASPSTGDTEIKWVQEKGKEIDLDVRRIIPAPQFAINDYLNGWRAKYSGCDAVNAAEYKDCPYPWSVMNHQYTKVIDGSSESIYANTRVTAFDVVFPAISVPADSDDNWFGFQVSARAYDTEEKEYRNSQENAVMRFTSCSYTQRIGDLGEERRKCRELQPCPEHSNVGSTFFIKTRPTLYNDMVCAPYETECNFTQAFVSGRRTRYSDRMCTPLNQCLENNTFIAVNSTAYSDNICRNYTQCDDDPLNEIVKTGNHYEDNWCLRCNGETNYAKITEVNSTLCEPFTLCDGITSFVSVRGNASMDNVCQNFKFCNSTHEYIIRNGDLYHDFECSEHVRCDGNATYVMKNGTIDHPEECAQITKCDFTTQYIVRNATKYQNFVCQNMNYTREDCENSGGRIETNATKYTDHFCNLTSIAKPAIGCKGVDCLEPRDKRVIVLTILLIVLLVLVLVGMTKVQDYRLNRDLELDSFVGTTLRSPQLYSNFGMKHIFAPISESIGAELLLNMYGGVPGTFVVHKQRERGLGDRTFEMIVVAPDQLLERVIIAVNAAGTFMIGKGVDEDGNPVSNNSRMQAVPGHSWESVIQLLRAPNEYIETQPTVFVPAPPQSSNIAETSIDAAGAGEIGSHETKEERHKALLQAVWVAKNWSVARKAAVDTKRGGNGNAYGSSTAGAREGYGAAAVNAPHAYGLGAVPAEAGTVGGGYGLATVDVVNLRANPAKAASLEDIYGLRASQADMQHTIDSIYIAETGFDADREEYMQTKVPVALTLALATYSGSTQHERVQLRLDVQGIEADGTYAAATAKKKESNSNAIYGLANARPSADAGNLDPSQTDNIEGVRRETSDSLAPTALFLTRTERLQQMLGEDPEAIFTVMVELSKHLTRTEGGAMAVNPRGLIELELHGTNAGMASNDEVYGTATVSDMYGAAGVVHRLRSSFTTDPTYGIAGAPSDPTYGLGITSKMGNANNAGNAEDIEGIYGLNYQPGTTAMDDIDQVYAAAMVTDAASNNRSSSNNRISETSLSSESLHGAGHLMKPRAPGLGSTPDVEFLPGQFASSTTRLPSTSGGYGLGQVEEDAEDAIVPAQRSSGVAPDNHATGDGYGLSVAPPHNEIVPMSRSSTSSVRSKRASSARGSIQFSALIVMVVGMFLYEGAMADAVSDSVSEATYVATSKLNGLEGVAAKLGQLITARYDNDFDSFFYAYDMDASESWAVDEFVPCFAHAGIGSAPSRVSWIAAFIKTCDVVIPDSLPAQGDGIISKVEMKGAFEALGLELDDSGANAWRTFSPQLEEVAAFDPLNFRVGYAHFDEPDSCQTVPDSSLRSPPLVSSTPEECKVGLETYITDDAQCSKFTEKLDLSKKQGRSCPCVVAATNTQCFAAGKLVKVSGGHLAGNPLIVSHAFATNVVTKLNQAAVDANVHINVVVGYHRDHSAFKSSSSHWTEDVTMAESQAAERMGESIEFSLLLSDGTGTCAASCFESGPAIEPEFTKFQEILSGMPGIAIIKTSSSFKVPQVISKPDGHVKASVCGADDPERKMPYAFPPRCLPCSDSSVPNPETCKKRLKYMSTVLETAYDHGCFELMTLDAAATPPEESEGIATQIAVDEAAGSVALVAANKDLKISCNDRFAVEVEKSENFTGGVDIDESREYFQCQSMQAKFLILRSGLQRVEAAFALKGKWSVVYSHVADPDAKCTENVACAAFANGFDGVTFNVLCPFACKNSPDVTATIKPPGHAAGPILIDIAANAIRWAAPLLLADGYGLEVHLRSGAVVLSTRAGTSIPDAFKVSAESDSPMPPAEFEVWAKHEFDGLTRFVENMGVLAQQGKVTETFGRCDKTTVFSDKDADKCCDPLAYVIIAGSRNPLSGNDDVDPTLSAFCESATVTAALSDHNSTAAGTELEIARPCPEPVPLPLPRSKYFRWGKIEPPADPEGALDAPDDVIADFCLETASFRKQHFLDVWEGIYPRYKFLDATRYRSMVEVRSHLEYCFSSCTELTHVDAPEGTIARARFEACEAAVHWLPLDFGNADSTCHLAMSSSILLKEACFWGKCLEDTTLFKVLRPSPTYLSGTDGDVLPLYGNNNPNPIIDVVQQSMATECGGIVTMWIGSLSEFGAVQEMLRTLIAFNQRVTLLEVRVAPTAYKEVQAGLSSLQDDLKIRGCRRYTREFLTPVTLTRLDAIRLSKP